MRQAALLVLPSRIRMIMRRNRASVSFSGRPVFFLSSSRTTSSSRTSGCSGGQESVCAGLTAGEFSIRVVKKLLKAGPWLEMCEGVNACFGINARARACVRNNDKTCLHGITSSLVHSWSEITLLSGTGVSFLLASSRDVAVGLFCLLKGCGFLYLLIHKIRL